MKLLLQVIPWRLDEKSFVFEKGANRSGKK